MLTPCAQCRRHVQSTELRCPFCAGALAASSARCTTLVGRVSRAVVFGSAALTATACDQGARSDQPAARSSPAVGTIKGKATWSGTNMYGSHTRAVEAGTEILLLGEDGKIRQSTKTNANGEFEFANVAVGTYRVELQQAAEIEVHVHENAVEQADLVQVVALPYGSPPARRRIV